MTWREAKKTVRKSAKDWQRLREKNSPIDLIEMKLTYDKGVRKKISRDSVKGQDRLALCGLILQGGN